MTFNELNVHQCDFINSFARFKLFEVTSKVQKLYTLQIIYTYIYAYAYTYIHIHIHIYTYACIYIVIYKQIIIIMYNFI